MDLWAKRFREVFILEQPVENSPASVKNTVMPTVKRDVGSVMVELLCCSRMCCDWWKHEFCCPLENPDGVHPLIATSSSNTPERLKKKKKKTSAASPPLIGKKVKNNKVMFFCLQSAVYVFLLSPCLFMKFNKIKVLGQFIMQNHPGWVNTILQSRVGQNSAE